MTTSSEPVVWFDFEFAFLHGVPVVSRTIADGAWSVKNVDQGVKVFQFRYDDGVMEELIVQPHAVAYVLMRRREEPPATAVEDGGRTRVVGSVN